MRSNAQYKHRTTDAGGNRVSSYTEQVKTSLRARCP